MLADNSDGLCTRIVHNVTRPETVLDKAPARLKNNFNNESLFYIVAVCLTRRLSNAPKSHMFL